MNKYSAKNKIIILCISWAVISAAMFLYFFKFLDASNQQALDGMATQKQNLAVLQGEKQVYDLAQVDLKKLSEQPLQPQSFFDKDITLVNEIQTLEDWGSRLNVKMQLSGISGTINSQPQDVNTTTSIVEVPYGISISGSLDQIIEFMEVLENLNFVTNVKSVSVQAAGNGMVNVGLAASFYLTK